MEIEKVSQFVMLSNSHSTSQRFGHSHPFSCLLAESKKGSSHTTRSTESHDLLPPPEWAGFKRTLSLSIIQKQVNMCF